MNSFFIILIFVFAALAAPASAQTVAFTNVNVTRGNAEQAQYRAR